MTTRHTFKILLSLFTLISISACGGGGGGGGGGGVTRYTVTATTGTGGSVSPMSVQVDANATTLLTISPDTNYVLDGVSGSCTGQLSGNDYTAGPVTANCAANFTFRYVGPPLSPAAATLGSGPQQLVLNWTDSSEATFYRVLENPDGVSGYSPISGDIASGVQTYAHPVTLYRRINASYILQSCNAAGCSDGSPLTVTDLVSPIVYLKADNTGNFDSFGVSVSLSADGNTLAVGAISESSNAQTINGAGNNDLANNSGAVYVFIRSGNSWSQQAYIKASDAGPNDIFGSAVSLSDDGNLLAVGAPVAAIGGVVYLYSRSGSSWSELQVLDNVNTDNGDKFGASVSLSGNGTALAIGVPGEGGTGAGVDPANNNAGSNNGAVYLYQAGSPTWVPVNYIKASNPGNSDGFGTSVALNRDGTTLVVGAPFEDSPNVGNPDLNTLLSSGAVYIFRFTTVWSQQLFLKPASPAAFAVFGKSVDLDAAGNRLAVGAFQQDGGANLSGAVYLFDYSGFWNQYPSALNPGLLSANIGGANDNFGFSVQLSADGNTLAVGAPQEDSSDIGVAADANNDIGSDSGAAYVFRYDGSWTQLAFIKARHRDDSAGFGSAIALSADGDTLAAGADSEQSTTTGIGSTPNQNGAGNGAVFVY